MHIRSGAAHRATGARNIAPWWFHENLRDRIVLTAYKSVPDGRRTPARDPLIKLHFHLMKLSRRHSTKPTCGANTQVGGYTSSARLASFTR